MTDHHEEFAVPRPGFKLPLVCVVQTDTSRGEGFAWGVYSQRSTRPLGFGHEPTIEEARTAARAGAEKCVCTTIKMRKAR